MYRISVGFLVAAMACAAVQAYAATPAGTITRESLVSSEVLNKLSVGADFISLDREVHGHGTKADLEARIYGAYVGYDALPWLTVFATLGGCQIKDDYGYWSTGTKWSLGAAPNIWEGDLRRPSFLAGKLSLSAMGEIGRYESSQGDADGDWMEYAAAFFVRYEVSEDAPWSAESVTSLRFSAGPVVSKVKGDVRGSGSKWSFDESKSMGWMACVDWFVAPTLSIGGGVQVFDNTSVSASLRLHF